MKKSEFYGYMGTAIFGILILLLLFLVVMPGLRTPEDGGVMISFGDSFDGGGSVQVPNQNLVQTSTPVPAKQEELLTQTESSVVITEQKRRTEPTPRPNQQEIERQRREQEASQKADDLIGGSFGSAPTSGSGQNSAESTAGNPVGSGVSGGNSWSLSGRNLVGTMPTPNYNINEEGFITVNITVDAAGNVTSANVFRYSISNKTLWDEALSAARRTRFTSGSGIARGTITYNFKLR